MEKLQPKLRFPDFERDWNQKKLGEILSITSASRVHKNEWKENGVRFFRTSDVVSHFKGNDNTKAFISFELYESLSNKIGRVKKDDILITGGGSIGIPYLIKDEEPLYFKDADLLWIKNIDDINGYFLYSFLLTESFRDYLNNISHTGTIAHFTVNQAKNTPFTFPSLQEQTKIALFLSAVDDKINLLKEKKAGFEEYKKGMMQKIFSQEIRFKDEKGYEFTDWVKIVLKDVFDYKKGSGLSKDKLDIKGKYSCILYGELYTKYNEVIFKVISKTNSNEGLQSIKGDLLIPSSTTTSGIDLANVTALNYDNVLLGGDITVLRSNQNVSSIFYAYYLSNHKKEEIASYAQGITIVHLYYNHIKDMIIDFPCIEEQTKIASFLSAIDEKIELVTTQIEETQEYKKGLLQGMFC